jgi:hypothetical protein
VIYILIGIAFFLIFVLIAVRIGIKVQKPEEPAEQPMIHASGIYSIVRRSPRHGVAEVKPTAEKVRQYLASANEDIQGSALTENEKAALAKQWSESLEKNIREVEAGDHQGIEFYYYDFPDSDPICKGLIDKGHYVTREEIFKFPLTIPPFHIGCRCMLKAHHGAENLRETTELGMRPLFRDVNLPPLPDWKRVLKLPQRYTDGE